MDIRAIVLIGGVGTDGGNRVESIGRIPIAYLDVLGAPVVDRVVNRLQHYGITIASLISDAPEEAEPFTRCTALDSRVPQLQVSAEQFWQAAEEDFQSCVEDGAELVVVLRIGVYVEADYEELIQHHLDRRNAITQAVDVEQSALPLFIISASARSDAAELFQSRLQRLRRESEPFPVSGYVNRLATASNLRQLAVDGLLRRNAVAPEGREMKPGIWLGAGARVHRKARVVAPAFIGAHSKIRALALITRGTVIEQHSVVDCGTVVENSSVLPFSCLGAGLDVMHCVVGFRRLTHLVRGVEVEIHDGKLLGMMPFSAVSRLAGSTAALFAFIPKEIYRGFLARFHRKEAMRSVECSEEATPALETPGLETSAPDSEAAEFPSNLAVVRRYGDQ